MGFRGAAQTVHHLFVDGRIYINANTIKNYRHGLALSWPLGLGISDLLRLHHLSMLVVWLLAESINMIVITGEGGEFISLGDVDRTRLIWMALGLMGASIMRGLFDFARTYTTDSLSQKVAYDLRNDMYDKLQHLSFAFHDKEHTGNLMSKVTADVEAVRRFIMMGLVRSFEVGIRVVAITCILVFLNWELTLMSLAFVPFLVYRSTKVQATMRGAVGRACRKSWGSP